MRNRNRPIIKNFFYLTKKTINEGMKFVHKNITETMVWMASRESLYVAEFQKL